jgi:two-component system response regulator HydG
VLRSEGFDAKSVHGPDAALAEARRAIPDAVVTDWRMPGMTGLELFLALRDVRKDIVGIIVTAFGTMETAVESMKAGIADFASKPVDPDEVAIKLRKALRLRTLENENALLRTTLETGGESADIVGKAPVFRDVVNRAVQAAQSRATVLLTGESGTGKELLARLIHVTSPRKSGPDVRVNCAAMPETLLESELFGYRKGASTGAVADRKGRFDLAAGGTIFLDEIAEIPLHLQAKLLRVLQEHEVEPLGGEGPHEVDVRVIAATHRDLKKMVAAGTFREDLRYRLHVIELRLPALRDRRSDIPLLAEAFLRRFATRDGRPQLRFTDAALDGAR